MNGTVGRRWALRKRGTERNGGGGGLLDAGGCWKTPPTKGVSKQRACFETVSKHPPQESTSNNSGIDKNIEWR